MSASRPSTPAKPDAAVVPVASGPSARAELIDPPPPEFHIAPLQAEELRELFAGLAEDDPRRLEVAEQIDIAEGRASYNQALFEGASEEPWPQLDMPILPPFPLEAFPESLRRFAEAVADETQTPVDMAACMMLTTLAAAAQGIEVNVNGGGWDEQLSLYILVTMKPGERKSGVMNLVGRPLEAIESEILEQQERELRRRLTRLGTLKKRRDKLQGDAIKLSRDEAREIEEQLDQIDDEIAEIGEPVAFRLLASDSTPEALVGLLAQHQRIAVVAGEGAVIMNALGRYSDKPNLDTLCQAYQAETIRVDRKNNAPLVVRKPQLTIGLVVQEHVLKEVMGNPIAKSQGLTSRFAFSLPETRRGGRLGPKKSPPVPAELADAWAALVKKIYALNPLTEMTELAARGNSVSSVSDSQEAIGRLSLSPLGFDLVDAHANEREPRVAETGDLDPIVEWVQRHDGRAIRYASLLHLVVADDPRWPVHVKTLENGYLIAEYFLAHSQAALTRPDPLERKALKWLTKAGRPRVSVRDLQRGPLNSRETAEDAKDLAERLCVIGALRPAAMPGREGPGQPKSPEYLVNPRLFEAPAPAGLAEPNAAGQDRR